MSVQTDGHDWPEICSTNKWRRTPESWRSDMNRHPPFTPPLGNRHLLWIVGTVSEDKSYPTLILPSYHPPFPINLSITKKKSSPIPFLSKTSWKKTYTPKGPRLSLIQPQAQIASFFFLNMLFDLTHPYLNRNTSVSFYFQVLYMIIYNNIQKILSRFLLFNANSFTLDS